MAGKYKLIITFLLLCAYFCLETATPYSHGQLWGIPNVDSSRPGHSQYPTSCIRTVRAIKLWEANMIYKSIIRRGTRNSKIRSACQCLNEDLLMLTLLARPGSTSKILTMYNKGCLLTGARDVAQNVCEKRCAPFYFPGHVTREQRLRE